MTEKYTNNFVAHVQNSLDADETDIILDIVPPANLQVTLASGDTWVAKIGDELVLVTDYDDITNSITVERAQEDTTTQLHDAGAIIAQVISAGSLERIIGEAIDIEIDAVDEAESINFDNTNTQFDGDPANVQTAIEAADTFIESHVHNETDGTQKLESENVIYDNTQSGLTAENTQDAIDEHIAAVPAHDDTAISHSEASTYDWIDADTVQLALQEIYDEDFGAVASASEHWRLAGTHSTDAAITLTFVISGNGFQLVLDASDNSGELFDDTWINNQIDAQNFETKIWCASAFGDHTGGGADFYFNMTLANIRATHADFGTMYVPGVNPSVDTGTADLTFTPTQRGITPPNYLKETSVEGIQFQGTNTLYVPYTTKYNDYFEVTPYLLQVGDSYNGTALSPYDWAPAPQGTHFTGGNPSSEWITVTNADLQIRTLEPLFDGSYNGGNFRIGVDRTSTYNVILLHEINGTGKRFNLPFNTSWIIRPGEWIDLQFSTSSSVFNGRWKIVGGDPENIAYNAFKGHTTLINSGTHTFPTAVGVIVPHIVKNTSDVNTITLATTSAQTIDGVAPGTLLPLESITVISDNANWFVI